MAATAAWPLSGGGGGGGGALGGALGGSLGGSLGSSTLAAPAMTAAPSTAAARAVVPAAAPPTPPAYRDLLRVVLLQRTVRAAAVAAAIGTAVLLLAVGALRGSLLLPGVWLSATAAGLVAMLPLFVAVKRSVQGTRGRYTRCALPPGRECPVLTAPAWTCPCRAFGRADALAQPTASAGAIGGYVGVASTADVVYIGAHVWSALVTAALLASAWDGRAPQLWTGRPVHLVPAAWPPLVMLLTLSVGAALHRLVTRPRWLWLPAVVVRAAGQPRPRCV